MKSKKQADTPPAVPSDKPPKSPTTRVKVKGRLKHPLFKVGKVEQVKLAGNAWKFEDVELDEENAAFVSDLVKSPVLHKNKVLRWVLTCPADRTQVFGKGKKAKSVTAPCLKMMAVHLEHGNHKPQVRCCFCYAEHNTAALIKAGHLKQEDL